MIERGSVVLVSAQGDYGKTRPAVVVQNGRLIGLIDSVVVCFMTSDLTKDGPMRVTVEPSAGNRLQAVSQVQVEKLMTFPSGKARGPIGALTEDEMNPVSRALLFVLDLAQPLYPPAVS